MAAEIIGRARPPARQWCSSTTAGAGRSSPLTP